MPERRTQYFSDESIGQRISIEGKESFLATLVSYDIYLYASNIASYAKCGHPPRCSPSA
jgi:hypothetical protein